MAPTSTTLRRSAAALLLGLIVTGPGAAAAVPEPGPTRPSGPPAADCPLGRVDHHLVRCDSLTGAGVPAPAWVPERGTR
jgi:hypothetical protein